jgi:hypothetical protein
MEQIYRTALPKISPFENTLTLKDPDILLGIKFYI